MEDKIKKIIKKAKRKGYGHIGVRISEKWNNSRSRSRDWDVENDCFSREYLPGLCTIDINVGIKEAVEILNKKYEGSKIMIVAGYKGIYGNDDREKIILPAKVWWIL